MTTRQAGYGIQPNSALEETVATAYIAARVDIQKARLAFEQAGYPLAGLTFPVFAAENLFGPAGAKPAGSSFGIVHIADDHSRITLFERGRLVLTRSVRSGITTLVDALSEDPSAPLSPDQARSALLSVVSETDGDAPSVPAPCGRDEVLSLLRPALQRLARQVERTLAFYSVESQTPRVEHLYVTGVLAPCHDITAYVAEQINATVHPLEPFEQLDLAPGVQAPPELQERTAYALPLGLALSQWERTPNLLYTHQDREKHEYRKRFQKCCFLVFLLLLAAAAAVDHWQRGLAEKRHAYLTSILSQLADTDEPITNDRIEAMLTMARQELDTRKRVAKRSLALAVFAELSQKTPEHVRLLTAVLDLGHPPLPTTTPGSAAAGPSPANGKEPAPPTLVLTGYVTGQSELLESRLVQYIIGLENSPLLNQLSLKTSQTESYTSGDVLYFSLRAGIAAPRPQGDTQSAGAGK